MGDGNYQMHPMELVTAMQERAKITIILNVNDGYQSIHGHQKALVGQSLGNEFKIRDGQSGLLDKGEFIQIDYVKNAESVGVKAWLAEDESAFKQALSNARDGTAFSSGMKELTLKGIGVGWLPYSMVHRELETGDLISLANTYGQEPLEVAIYADIKEEIALAVLQVWSKAPNIREEQTAQAL